GPAVVRLAGAWVGGRVVSVAVVVAVFTGDDDRADLDGRVHRSHLREIVFETLRIRVGIVRARVVVGLPRPVVFVADLPILKGVAFGDVAVADPVGGFGGGAGAVVDRHEHPRGGGRGDVREGVERRRPLPGVVVAGVGLPVIFVGQRAAGETQGL